jgi:4-amino-4-deoxy-L-arabinose transferase-like glycosyltransferase
MKGLPAPVFQGISLLVLFAYSGKFRKLLSWKHILGMAVFTLVIASYYLLYYLRNPEDITTLLARIINESTQKSALGATTNKTLIHLVKFPWDLMLHFAPWTLMAILLFNKAIWKRTISVPFIKYCMMAFVANLVIYWLSPVTYMRYLLMLFPLIFIVLLYMAKIHAMINTWNYRILKFVWLGGAILLIPVNSLLPIIFSNDLQVSHVHLKSLILLIAGLAALYLLHFSRNKSNLIYTLGVMLLISRIGFNIFLVPYRQIISGSNECRHDAVMLARSTTNQELFLMTDTITIPSAYYITRERDEILRFARDYKAGPYYIVDDTTLFGDQFRKEYSMRVPLNNRSFYAGRFNQLFHDHKESMEILK